MNDIYLYVAVMAGTTYLIRAVPFFLIKGDVHNRFLRSLLAYVPFAVLSAMVLPGIFFVTDSLSACAAGFAAALIFSFAGMGLMTVAVAASLVVLGFQYFFII